MKDTHVLVLAAGASTRLGRPKQLVEVGGKSLLERTCEVALQLDNQGIIVVLGAFSEAIRPAIACLPVQIVVNENWEQGMGSTIACGMAHLPSSAGAVLLLLCDQPFVTASYLRQMLGKWHSKAAPIVASAYGGSWGPPAVFDRRYFAELAALHGQQGAKRLFEVHKEQVCALDFPEGTLDVDTPEDLARLGATQQGGASPTSWPGWSP